MEKIDIGIAEILADYLLNGDAMLTSNRLKELFGYEALAPIDERVTIFKRKVYGWNYANKKKYDNAVLASFIELWIRIEDGKRMKFELEKNFKIGGRLAMFTKLDTKFAVTKKIDQFRNALGGVNPLR